MWNITWELILEIRCKCLGRIWGVPCLLRNFLGILPCMEMGFVTSCVHFRGVQSIFLSARRLMREPRRTGSARRYCAVHRVQHCAMDCLSLSLSVFTWTGSMVKRKGKGTTFGSGPAWQRKRGRRWGMARSGVGVDSGSAAVRTEQWRGARRSSLRLWLRCSECSSD
jgi:hypothetical protein